MSREEIDDYLAGLEEPKRSTLEALRRSILAVVPDAEQCISYGVPGFRVAGKMIAGFAAFKNHLRAICPTTGPCSPNWRMTCPATRSPLVHCGSPSTVRFRRRWSRS